MIHSLDQMEIKGRQVFVRLDLNVPLRNGEVQDDTRIRGALPTIRAILEKGGRPVLASHLGRPKGKFNPALSLEPVGAMLAERLGKEVVLTDDCIGDGVKGVLTGQREGQIVLLENLRFHAEETANDALFAEQLKGSCTVYINDAFGALHRSHASVDGLARLFEHRAAGLLVQRELVHLTPLREGPGRPYVVILGGAKVSDKIGVLESFLDRANSIIVGGAMAYTFLKAAGHPIGTSRCEDDQLRIASRIVERASARGIEVLLPTDHIAAPAPDQDEQAITTDGTAIPDGMMGLDVGPKTIRRFQDRLIGAKTVFWNGPLGMFEVARFAEGTNAIAKTLASLKARTIVGGGDSAAAINAIGLANQVTHVSTGGGASLEFVKGQTLPGLAALEM